MNTLNHEYNGSPFTYEFDQDNRTLTLMHSKGGENNLLIVLPSAENLVMDLEVVSGDGEDTTISYDEVLTSASAEGLEKFGSPWILADSSKCSWL